ncbi:MAG TPA: hypothetical protein DER56_01240, partial [Thermosipho africanus]|nr:hypothetical protein [Thermosipho africanus]
LLKRLKKIKKEVVEKLDKTLQSYQQKLANENFNFLKKLEKNIKESDESWNIIKAQYINKLEKFYSEISKISIYTIKMIHRHYNDNSTTGI